ncbi:sensor histidine kinase [Acidisoma silvae]|uniref:histidine kinase n=1 Tax=Acidisoma silvae TaxID=2802396 RepID=A0A963YQK1_9PROT|nr:HAMP domain-containing sensor histidine kinase [Acidisoma silvae]MCB8874857.1 HAMP domain-containing histidine kinase [Acidisoma silvae]
MDAARFKLSAIRLRRPPRAGTVARVPHCPGDRRRAFFARLRGSPLLRSAGLRFAALYAIIFGLSAVALAIFLWWATAGLLNRQVEAAINADAQGLGERYQEGGVPALILTIQDRLSQNVDENAIYLLADNDLHPIAGNLAIWPKEVSGSDSWFELTVQRGDRQALARLRRYDLPGGFHLLIGRDVGSRAKLRSLLTAGLLWAVLVMVVLGSAGAIAIQSLFRRSLADVSATANAISRGDLSNRVRISGRGDEFDRLAETINDMLDRIARLMDGVRQVSNAIAHDLRTPITRARARLEDAALHARDAGDLHAAVERATSDLDGIVSVFQGLLRIAEIEAGARRSAFASLDLYALLADMHELYGAAAEEQGQQIDLLAQPPLPMFGDRDLLQQAVANLLENALKFSPPGKPILLGAGRLGDRIEIVVADSGPGIPPEDRMRVTERFYRGESARSTPGSGLGLSLVQAVVQLHNGTLRLEDNHPGVRAVLSLPAEFSASRRLAKTDLRMQALPR